MMKKALYRSVFCLFVGTALAAVAACSSEEAPVVPPEAGDTFTVTAEVARQLYSRAYQESGDVKDGIYYLSYPLAAENSYKIAKVTFNKKDESNPEIGFVTDLDDSKELKWIDISQGTPTFYLDNVAPDVATGEESTLTRIVFGNDNPYKAALFDKENGTNDLLWGTTTARHGFNTVDFELHHCMSRLRVEVTVDKTNEHFQDDLNLEGATVEISSIRQTPRAYNRFDGSLELDTLDASGSNYSEVYSTLTLVNPENDKLTWDGEPIVDKTNENKETYTTKDFVLPPQGLLGDANRPRLIITLKNGRKYSGILPHAMLIGDYPVALYFLREHILTIRTVITEEPPELAFMPVWVVEWVDKGEFTVEGHQAGIYRPEEFYKLIDYYKSYNEYHLPRYGRLVTEGEGESATEKWRFDFFRTVTLEYGRIQGKMELQSKDFSFNFNGYAVYVQCPNESDPKQVDEQKLYNIVTGKESLP